MVRRKVPQLEPPQDMTGVEGSGSQLRLLVVGESTMAGIGVDSHAEGFAGTLAKELADKKQWQIDWEVIAKSGYNMQMINEELL